jgi:hypothetical protein
VIECALESGLPGSAFAKATARQVCRRPGDRVVFDMGEKGMTNERMPNGSSGVLDFVESDRRDMFRCWPGKSCLVGIWESVTVGLCRASLDPRILNNSGTGQFVQGSRSVKPFEFGMRISECGMGISGLPTRRYTIKPSQSQSNPVKVVYWVVFA